MEEKNKIEETVEIVNAYINTRYELIVLKTSEKVSGVLSEILSGVLIGFIFILAFILFSFAAAYYLSARMGSTFSGFLIVGGTYLVIVFFLAVFSKRIFARSFRNKIIKLLHK